MKPGKTKIFFSLAALTALLLTLPALAGAVALNFSQEGGILPGPGYNWWYGCSATSAGMMMGYYDRHGYAGKSYADLMPGGQAEANTFPVFNNWSYLANQAIASYGHVTDFYRDSAGNPDYSSQGHNAFNGQGDDRAPAHSFNSLADFMGTSQDAVGNMNGSTTFYYWGDGSRLYAKDAFTYNIFNRDGMYGMAEYLRYAGYGGDPSSDTNFFTARIYSAASPKGFTYADYQAEIDAGRVVMIHVQGHSMFGYGYDPGTATIYLQDTWTDGVHTMTWGDSYGGLQQWGVTCFTPTGGTVVTPLPSSLLLLAPALFGLLSCRKRSRG